MSNKIRFPALLIFILLFTLPCVYKPSAMESAPVSPALSIIADSLEMKKSGLLNTDIFLTSDDFEEFFAIERLDSITVSCLPSKLEGTLYLGNTPVVTNQTVYKKDIKSLRFSPADPETRSASFLFSVNNISIDTPIRCSLYLFSEINCSPVITQAVLNGERLTTLKNIMVHSSVEAEDYENDSIYFEVTEQPLHGVVNFPDPQSGKFTYTPASDYVGKDRFEVCAVDQYGNRSEKAWVEIYVEKNNGDIFFKDMIGREEHLDAVKAAQYELMSGKLINGEMCFSPDSTVTKAEFLRLAMTAAGISIKGASVETAFTDDADIPTAYKGYVAAAADMGYVSGIKTENGVFFYPNSPITAAEASDILTKLLASDTEAIAIIYSRGDSVQSSANGSSDSSDNRRVFEYLSDSPYTPDAEITNALCAKLFCSLFVLTQ